MSDDSFFREVSEELRQDRVKAIWTRFGAYILAAVAVVILATAGYVGWERYSAGLANASGDRYMAALKLAEDGKPDEAVKALQAISEDGYGAYPDLARMSIGAVRESQNQGKEAVAAFDRVANDTGAPQPIRDMAAIRAAYVLVDIGTLAEVQDRVQRLAGDSDPMRFPAREAIGLAAWKAGDAATAKKSFQQLADDASAPQGIAGRARLMLDVINSGNGASAAAATPGRAASSSPAAPVASDTSGSNVSEGATGSAAMPTTDLGTAKEPSVADETAPDAAPAGSASGSSDAATNAPRATAPAAGSN